MKKFLIITNPEKDRDYRLTAKIEDYLCSRGMSVARGVHAEGCQYGFVTADSVEEDTDCAIVLGGDGTILHAALCLAEHNIPLLGVNLGTLGFLAEVQPEKVEEALDRVVTGDYYPEEHMMLETEIEGRKVHFLNDVTVTAKGYSRLLTLNVYINGLSMQEYSGDGLLISTPTGSTAYNLSAGGPVLSHDANMIVVTPICPHSLGNRSLVLSDKDRIMVEYTGRKNDGEDRAVITIDGTLYGSLSKGDRLEIRRSQRSTTLIRLEEEAFYKALKKKLGWGN